MAVGDSDEFRQRPGVTLGTLRLRPVVAADLGADLRRSPELAQGQHRAILVQPALAEILDQGADALVEDREVLRLA
jgi:hypothetical protein